MVVYGYAVGNASAHTEQATKLVFRYGNGGHNEFQGRYPVSCSVGLALSGL